MGFLLLVSLQFKPLCVCVCVPSSLSVQILRLSSWTISQIRDMCLMFSWKRAEGTCWAPYDIYFLRQGWKNRERVTARWSKTGDKFLSRLIMYCFVGVFFVSLSVCFWHIKTHTLKMKINCKETTSELFKLHLIYDLHGCFVRLAWAVMSPQELSLCLCF